MAVATSNRCAVCRGNGDSQSGVRLFRGGFGKRHGEAWAGGGFLAQGFAFAASSLITLLFLRPLILREMAKRTPKTATNSEALLGVAAHSRSDITEFAGEITLRGEVWSARSTTGTIPAGQRVRVADIDGAIAIVESSGESSGESTVETPVETIHESETPA